MARTSKSPPSERCVAKSEAPPSESERCVAKNVPKSVILGTKWVAVARIGLILWELEATGSGEVLRCLPVLQNVKIRLTNYKKISNID